MDGMANPVSHRYQRGQFLRMFCLLFFCLISQQLTGVKATEDPCLIATEIYEPHRSTAYNVPPERPDLLCDRYLEEGWYRFTSHVGGRMPTSCVEPFYCGTSSPIWMNGEHPTGDDIVDRVACVTLQVPDYCCYGEYPIQVKRCIEGGNTFYVYKLTPTHVCNEAYCAGDQPPCPDGEVYNEFLRQCGDVIPMMTEDPVLHPPVVNDDWTQVTFTCEVKYDATDPTANFEVSFLFNNEYFDDVPNKILTARKRHATLDAKHLGLYQDYQNDRIIWPSKMGKHVSCEVRSFWENSPTVKSDWHQSNTYWAGIEASEHVAVIEERGELYPLQLYSTVPFVCSFGRKWVNQCYIKVPLDFDKNAKDASIAEACQITFKATDWDSVTHRIEAEAVLVAVKDFQADQDKHMVINFRQITQGSVVVGREVNPHIFHGYTPQFNVQVRTVDTITGRCISWGDPHIIMFDRPDDWNLQAHPIPVGEFNLYSSTKPNRLFQVQARHRQCAMNRKKEIISCNCGVAVREGDDAVIIDRCDGYYRPPSYKTTSGGPLSPGVTIKRDKTGNQIRITMPSGASVKVEGRIWMTITMHAPGIDFGHTEGLCGTFDGNPDNDLMMPDGSIASHHIWEDWHREFSSGWRIPHGTSLFDVDCLPEGPSSPLAQSQYCTCVGGGSVECDWTKTRQENPIAGVNTEVAPNQAQTNRECARRRRKREVQNIEDNPLLYNDDVEVTEYVFDYGEDSEPEVNDQWPTPSLGITEQQARDFCQQSIWNLTIAEACQDVYGVDLLAGVDSCIEDVQATEDYEFADIVVQRVQEECARNAYNNVSLYETNENGTAKPPGFITENLCPRQCSNQGRCVNASCECNDGYESADCSIRVGRPPVAVQIPANGLCDVRSRPCLKTSFFADGVMDSENLTCRITQVLIENGQLVRQESSGRSEAAFRSFAEVSCVLPRSPVRYGTPATNEGAVAHGMLLSISNDGDRFSEELFFTVYDSVCQECTQGGDCSWKPNTCIIRGHCFRNGDPNPDNWCQQCLPDLSNTTWSDRPINSPPRFTMTSNTITKLPDESLTMTLGAEDPEGRPVTFQTAPPSSPALTVQPNGQLTWTGDQPLSINVTITDECGASSEQTFHLTIMACPCQNGGSCVPGMPRGQGSYTCVCPGYTGDVCETELDECQSNPCVNGTCIDLVNGYNCTCAEGYIGSRCDVTIDNRCALDPCFTDVSCVNLEDGGYLCGRCPSGYIGNGYDCEDINECDTDSHGCLHVCRNLPGTYECACTDGFLLIADDCLDVDECALELHECSHDCTNTNGSYTCGCPEGFELNVDGRTCDDVNECASAPCQNRGECQDGVNQYTCSCVRGWFGTHCEEDIDECTVTNHGCEHECVNTPGSYGCSCPTGYVLSDDGKSCEDDDECRDESLCSHVCANTEGSYTCTCQPGYVLIPGTGQCGNDEATESPGTTGPMVLPTSTNEHDCRQTPCTMDHQECVEEGGAYTCRCAAGYYSAVIGTTSRCRKSVKHPAEFEVTVTHIGGEELVFTPELSDSESEEFQETAMILETALNEHLSDSLRGWYKGVKITSFREGSVIARFDIYLSQGPSDEDEVEDEISEALEDSTLGSSGVRIVPSSFNIIRPEDVPSTPWYKQPLYLALVCIGCAAAVTIAVVALVCYCKNNRQAMQRKRHIAGAADENDRYQGMEEPVHLRELRGATNKSFDDRQPVAINFVAPMYQ